MSLITSEIPSDNETMEITENNKRKFDEIDVVSKKCKVESSTTTTTTTTTTFAEDESNAILTDVTDNESSDSYDRGDKPMTFIPNVSDDCDNEERKQTSTEAIVCPKYGQIVNRREFRRAGPYIIGLKLGQSPVDSIVQYLAKKENTNEFVQLKILMLNNNTTNEKLQRDERQGKMLLHTEFSLLSLLQNEEGVIQQHGMFSDKAHEEVLADEGSNNNYFTGGLRKRLILVLDCVTPHDFSERKAYVNLQQYLINRRKLTEMEALLIFYEIVKVVERLHKRNIIHRDLKLGNIVLNKHSNKITITNFCLGKYLLNENDLLYDQRGSPAYISPDVLCGKPYKGKPSDMWALGVVLFMMLFRQFPFFEQTPTALFKKIKAAEYFIPLNCEMSKATEQIIKGLLQLNPEKRLTATEVCEKLKAIIDGSAVSRDTDHLVPEFSQFSINGDDKGHQSSSLESSFQEKWKKTNALNANDQVVPSMSTQISPPPTSATSAPLSGSRKRRRSTEKLLNEIAQRGISVQHVSSDARQLNANDIGQLQHLLRPNRIRVSGFQQLFPNTIRSAMSSSSPNSNSTTNRNHPPGISDFIRHFRIRDIQHNDSERSNRNSSPNVMRIERPTQQTIGSTMNMSPGWQYQTSAIRTTLSDLYRCAVTARGQQITETSRHNDQLRLIRRIRRARSSTNNPSNR